MEPGQIAFQSLIMT